MQSRAQIFKPSAHAQICIAPISFSETPSLHATSIVEGRAQGIFMQLLSQPCASKIAESVLLQITRVNQLRFQCGTTVRFLRKPASFHQVLNMFKTPVIMRQQIALKFAVTNRRDL